MNKNISIEAKIEPGVITVNDSSVLEETRTLKYPWKKNVNFYYYKKQAYVHLFKG